MNLYFFPGACSLAINIALREANLPFNLIEVDYETRSLGDGTDFRTVSPKGCVPVLQLDDATCLTESIAIFDHIDFCAPDTDLLGQRGTLQRQAALEWLSFIATEIHKTSARCFDPIHQQNFQNRVCSTWKKDCLCLRISFQSMHMSRDTTRQPLTFTCLHYVDG